MKYKKPRACLRANSSWFFANQDNTYSLFKEFVLPEDIIVNFLLICELIIVFFGILI